MCLLSSSLIYIVLTSSVLVLIVTGHPKPDPELGYFPQFPAHEKSPRVENYVPKGDMKFVEAFNMTVYESARNSSLDESRVIVVVYDIFAFHDHVKQIVDTVAVAKRGFRIVVPDFFHGTFYPGPISSWEEVVELDVARVLQYYKDDGAEVFGMFGFCWGGRISVKSGQVYGDDVVAVGLVHPSGVVTEDAETLKAAALLLPSGDDPNMVEFQDIVEGNLGVGSVIHHRFDDMVHGFAGASGDWSNPIINSRVDEVIEYLVNFFDEMLPSPTRH